MQNLIDESEAALGELFEQNDTERIFIIVGKSGLRVNWELSQEEAYSEKTRKRAYRNKIATALEKLSDADRKAVLSKIAGQIKPQSISSKKKDDLLPLLARGQYDIDLAELIARASDDSPLALIVVDLDHFKSVNDSFGHAAGDEVLIGVSGFLLRIVHGKGAAYRYGGEEICLLLPNFDPEEALALAQRARREIERATFEKVRHAITASFGVAVYPADGASASELFDAADKALYQSKSGGRNRVSSANLSRQSTTAPVSYSSVEDRVQAVDLNANVTQGMRGTFIFNITNNSDEEVAITKVTFAHDDFRIAEWEPPKSESHVIQPRRMISVSWNSTLDPVERLQKFSRIYDRNFETTVEITFHATILGKLRLIKQKILVQVDAGARRMWHL